MNQATRNLFELLYKAAEHGCKGGGFNGSGPYRPFFEPKQGDNTIQGLMDLLDRESLQVEWLNAKLVKDLTAHSIMKLQLQNDLVSQFHRDLQHRYSGRINRMLHETASAEHYADNQRGTTAMIETTVDNFLALSKGNS